MVQIWSNNTPEMGGTKPNTCTAEVKGKPQPETRNPRLATRDPRPETRGPKSKTRNPTPKIRNPRLETRNPKPEIQDAKPEIQDAKSETRNPRCKTRNLKPNPRNSRCETRVSEAHRASEDSDAFRRDHLPHRRARRAAEVKSQLPHQSVNLFFMLVIVNDKLTNLCGN